MPLDGEVKMRSSAGESPEPNDRTRQRGRRGSRSPNGRDDSPPGRGRVAAKRDRSPGGSPGRGPAAGNGRRRSSSRDSNGSGGPPRRGGGGGRRDSPGGSPGRRPGGGFQRRSPPRGGGGGHKVHRRRLHVSKLTRNVTQAHIRDLFSKFGDLETVDMIPDQRFSHMHRGFCYATFVRAEDAAEALDNMDGASVDGNYIRVEYARADPKGQEYGPIRRAGGFGDRDRDGGGGGGGGGYRGGGGGYGDRDRNGGGGGGGGGYRGGGGGGGGGYRERRFSPRGGGGGGGFGDYRGGGDDRRGGGSFRGGGRSTNRERSFSPRGGGGGGRSRSRSPRGRY